MNQKTYYDELQVSRDAKPEAIEAAHKALIVLHGISKRRYAYKQDSSDAEKVSQEISSAYEVLSDPAKRALYDAELAQQDEEDANKPDQQEDSVGQSTTPIKKRISPISIGLALVILTTIAFILVNHKLGKPQEITDKKALEKQTALDSSASQKIALQKANTLAEQGNAEAQFKLGAMHYAGDGVVKNYQEALKWYRLSADQGFPYAQYNLGCMYYAGEGVVKDDQEALKWYRLSADQGIASAQSSLGLMYANGQGVPQDFTQAMMWYSIAKAVGVAEAEQGLQQLEPQSTPTQIAEARRLVQEWEAHHQVNLEPPH